MLWITEEQHVSVKRLLFSNFLSSLSHHFSSSSYQFSHSILLLHFLLQLFETLLHALVERTQIIGHSLSVERDSST